MNTFIFPVWIFTSTLVLFVCTQSSTILCTVYAGNDIGGCLGNVIVATWLAMRLCNFSCLDLLLYLCAIGTLHVLPS